MDHKIQLLQERPKFVTIHQWRVESPFNLRVVDVWPAGTSFYVFLDHPNSATVHLMNCLCMWGGASKERSPHDTYPDAKGWEFQMELLPVIERLSRVL